MVKEKNLEDERLALAKAMNYLNEQKEILAKLNNELSIYQNTYEEALKKLTEISEQNLLLTQEYNEALTKLNSLNETIKEQEKTINILNNQLIEIKKPYANWPRWIVKLINFIINLFGGKKK